MDEKNTRDELKERIGNMCDRLDKVEKRLKKLESSKNPDIGNKKQKKSKKKETQEDEEISTDHNYLKKTIDEAKKRYEKERKI